MFIINKDPAFLFQVTCSLPLSLLRFSTSSITARNRNAERLEIRRIVCHCIQCMDIGYVGHNVVMLITDTNIRETCCLTKVTSLFILQLLLLLVYVQFHSVVRFIQIESYMYFSCLFSPKTVVSHFRSHILL